MKKRADAWPFRLVLSLLAAWVAAAASEGKAPPPDWLAKVPDFRSEWPPALAIGSAGPDFNLKDAATGQRVGLDGIREGKRVTLLLFIDDNCGECKRRKGDLAAALAGTLKVEGAAAAALFPLNGVKSGEKEAKDFSAQASLPAGAPVLLDQEGTCSKAFLAYRVSVTPCAVILDGEGKLAYFGDAFGKQGGAYLPSLVEAVVAGKPLDVPPVHRPFG